jgi:ABC-type antimicrobial peptide transport system permease subunit
VLRIPFIEGKTWSEADIAQARRLAIVNKEFERLYLSGKSAYGVVVRIPTMAPMFGSAPFRILGVTSDVRNQGLIKGVAPEIYLPYTLTGMSRHMILRAAPDPERVATAVVSNIHRIDPEQLITNVMTMDALLEKRLLSLSRFQLALFGVFASIGLILAVAGIYGVVSNTVETRRRELSIRLAIGASPSQVMTLVLHSGTQMVLVGIGLGLAGAILLTRLMAAMLFGVHVVDLVSIALTSVATLAAGLAACLEPAIRAARLDPARSLKQE